VADGEPDEIVRQRCGSEFVAVVVPERIFVEMMEVVLASEARLHDVESRTGLSALYGLPTGRTGQGAHRRLVGEGNFRPVYRDMRRGWSYAGPPCNARIRVGLWPRKRV
jgi:hypothetical protein